MQFTDILSDLRKIIRSVDLESKRIEKEFDISLPQLLSLSFLDNCDNYQSTHKEITKYLNLNSSTVTGIIDRLEKKNLVARLPKKEDKRVTYITLTAKGLTLLDKTPDLMQDRLLKKLSNAKPQEVENIKSALQMLIKFLDIKESEDISWISNENENKQL
jgi:DNA-binding MarR family transcriptional regulator